MISIEMVSLPDQPYNRRDNCHTDGEALATQVGSCFHRPCEICHRCSLLPSLCHLTCEKLLDLATRVALWVHVRPDYTNGDACSTEPPVQLARAVAARLVRVQPDRY